MRTAAQNPKIAAIGSPDQSPLILPIQVKNPIFAVKRPEEPNLQFRRWPVRILQLGNALRFAPPPIRFLARVHYLHDAFAFKRVLRRDIAGAFAFEPGGQSRNLKPICPGTWQGPRRAPRARSRFAYERQGQHPTQYKPNRTESMQIIAYIFWMPVLRNVFRRVMEKSYE